jgi:hypothetical protein
LAWTIDDAVSHQRLRDARIFVREVSFRLAELKPIIKIRLFRYPGDKEVYFELSHFIRLPGQTGTPHLSLKSDGNEAYALTHAVEALIESYDSGVKKGHEPSDAWLIPNPDYI